MKFACYRSKNIKKAKTILIFESATTTTTTSESTKTERISLFRNKPNTNKQNQQTRRAAISCIDCVVDVVAFIHKISVKVNVISPNHVSHVVYVLKRT